MGRRTERELWDVGITSWNEFTGFFRRPAPIGAALKRRLETYIPLSIEAVHRRDASFFGRLSLLGESWRLFPEFANECIYLDIETTGLSSVFDTVTIVGVFDGRRYEAYVDGQNLQDLPERLKNYSVIITFNGAGFDLRFLKLQFPNIQLPPIHIDLRWITRRLGYRGGLKEIEKSFGVSREESVQSVDGYEATLLWARYLRGDRTALRELIAYNSEDVVHLKAIMEMAYDQLASQITGGSSNRKKMFSRIARVPRPAKILTQTPQSHAPTLVSQLLDRSSPPSSKIVGIDLTGSERRATGWAVLCGTSAQTKSLVTDEELIRETLLAKPAVVSIDSPLSVPKGWNASQKRLIEGAPIYRRCELALKRMGISVFWCLLPSMQSLTMRGMRLAGELRRRGLRVIESYPGAAQDILGIPRKGSSLEELKWGLNRAGIKGKYLHGHVTHDEVDAITSALVGLFFLADDFIALGTPEEDYLIVPRSPKINYAKMDEILSATGLDHVPDSPSGGVKCNLHVDAASIPAFA